MYCAGRTTGLSIECGDGVCSTVPMIDGHSVAHAARRINFGGYDLTRWLQDALCARGFALGGAVALDTVYKMKEKLCYMAASSEEIESYSKRAQENVAPLAEVPQVEHIGNSQLEGVFTLPGGQTITLRPEERFGAAEALFRSNARADCPANGFSLPDMVCESINACDPLIRGRLFGNIVLSGGCAMVPGFAGRLTGELRARLPPAAEVCVRVASGDDDDSAHAYTAWSGGSVIGAMNTFQKVWVRRREYEEFGPGIVHRKCVL